MKYLKSILFKFLIVSILLEVLLNLITPLNFSQIIIMSIAVTLISFLIGDLIIYRFLGNTIATLGDIVLGFLTIYLFDLIRNFPHVSWVHALSAGVLIGASEWFFHKYLKHNVFE